MHTIPEKYKDEPKITLGGIQWAVPPLSARRIIRFGSLASSIMAISRSMPEADMMKIYEAIFTGVAQGLENGSQVSFDDWLDSYAVTFTEVLAALPVIAKQAGMEMNKATTAGEAEPQAIESAPSSTTGTIQ